jgi:hypothetical protein
MFPSFSYVPASTSQTYIILLVDLSINAASVNQSALDPQTQLPLAPGINANRTTRLHYWQPGLTFSSNGTVVNNTIPIAIYNPPRPPPGDIAHTYTFYLFEQEASFMPPANNSILSAGMVNMGMNRMSFNVGNLAKEMGVGPLVAANYYRVQNTMASATATTSSSSTSTSSATASTFTGGVEKPSVGLAALAMTASAILCALSMGS